MSGRDLFRSPSKRRPASQAQDVWLQDDSASDDPMQLPSSPRTSATLKTPQKATRVADLTAQSLRTPSGRTSRSQGLTNLTPQKSFIRKDATGAEVETFSVGDQVIVSGLKSTSAYRWLHAKKTGRPTTVEQWEHVDDLNFNDKVGLITELFQDEQGNKKVRLRWFARPVMLWCDGGPADGTPQDYEPWELCYVHDSDWCAAKQLLDHFIALGKKLTPDNMTAAEYAECSKALNTGSHTQDVLPISAITERVKVVPWHKFPVPENPEKQPVSEDGKRLFRCRRVYDSRPMAWDIDGFIKDVDFEQVLAKGLSQGLWDLHVERRDEEVVDEEAAERRRIERRNRIKEKNSKKRTAKVSMPSARKRSKITDVDSSGASSSENDDDADDDFDARAHQCSEPETDPESLPDDSSEGSAESESSEAYGVKKTKRAIKALPKAKMTAAQKAKQARLAERKRARLAARSGQRSNALRLPTNDNPHQAVLSTDPWARARQILHVSSTPAWLPCREEEFAELEAALEDSIDECSGCCLYISGVPGTGKTATVHSVIDSLQEKVKQGDLHKFRFFEINGMKVTEPSQAFVLFWEYLSQQESGGEAVQKRCSPREALSNLEHYFNSPSPTRETCVLLVDELDQLVTRKQEVIYNFFNWPNQPHSRLIVIAVANKMDLPETELNGKIRSRLGSNRIQFKPYNHIQLMEILNMRLDELTDTIFVKDAIQWISKKISSLTGDVRKALDLCRSTLEKVEKENEIRKANGEETRLVQVRDVIDTYEQMISSGVSRFIKQLSVHQSIMLLSISKAIKVAGIPEVEMGDVISRHIRFANSLGLTPEPTHEELSKIISSLQNMKLILNESSTFDYFSRIKLEIKDSDLNLIVKNDKRFSHLAI